MNNGDMKIGPGFRFKDGNVSFSVIEPADTPGTWYVRYCVPGFGFRRTKPKTTAMNEDRITELAMRDAGAAAASGMNTIGTRVGERSSRKKQNGDRYPLRFKGFAIRTSVAAAHS